MIWSRARRALAVLGVVHGTAWAQGPNVAQREIRSLLDASAAAWNQGDLEGQDGRAIQQLRFEQVTIHPLGSGYPLVVGRFVLEGGGQPEHGGWFSTIWERQAAGWWVIHDHSS
jgi:hypothetical protein